MEERFHRIDVSNLNGKQIESILEQVVKNPDNPDAWKVPDCESIGKSHQVRQLWPNGPYHGCTICGRPIA